MSTFWWEETYDPNLKVDTSVKTRIPTDNTGETFLKHRILTSSSQLSGLISPNGALSIVLGDSGRIHSAVTVYSNTTGEVVRTILVESKSGFMDLSSDGEILAVGVLKEVSTVCAVCAALYCTCWYKHGLDAFIGPYLSSLLFSFANTIPKFIPYIFISYPLLYIYI